MARRRHAARAGPRNRLVAGALALLCALPSLALFAPPARAEDGRMLWRISRAGVADSYVLGTIHVADPRISVAAPPIADALARSRTLLTELVPEAIVEADVEVLDGGERLEPLIGQGAYARLRALLAAQGMPDRTIERLKPWAALVRIARAAPRGGCA